MRTVGEVSELSGVTVRTLHHYDQCGLLSPSARSEAGYRLYSEGDLERLQEIIGWRALGFSLEEIRALLDDPSHDRVAALRAQLELVGAERARLAALATVLEEALAAHDTGAVIKEAAMFKGMHEALAGEARERWGAGDAYRESTARAASYGRREWREIHAQAREIEAGLARLLRDGIPPDAPEARALAEAHRQHISRWFYDCSREMHRALGAMYVSDQRFSSHYESRQPGLAAYMRAAIDANADATQA